MLTQLISFEGARRKPRERFYSKPIFRHLRMDNYSAQQRFWVYMQDKAYRILKQHEVALQIPQVHTHTAIRSRLRCRDKNACQSMRSRMCWLLAQDTPASRIDGPPYFHHQHRAPASILSARHLTRSNQGAESRLSKPYRKRSCMNACFE